MLIDKKLIKLREIPSVQSGHALDFFHDLIQAQHNKCDIFSVGLFHLNHIQHVLPKYFGEFHTKHLRYFLLCRIDSNNTFYGIYNETILLQFTFGFDFDDENLTGLNIFGGINLIETSKFHDCDNFSSKIEHPSDERRLVKWLFDTIRIVNNLPNSLD